MLVSAHWESTELHVSGARQPATLHDFGGFPAPLYQIHYPAPGSPALAVQIVELLAAAGLTAQIEPHPPLDHGAWVPLSLLYPQADIPVVQVSLPSRLGPALQNRIGHCLRVLRRQGVLLIGSGSITHNLGELDWQAGPQSIAPWAKEFRDWMVERLARATRLLCWITAARRPTPSATTPATSTCYRCSSPAPPASGSAWCIRALAMVPWAWTSTASTSSC